MIISLKKEIDYKEIKLIHPRLKKGGVWLQSSAPCISIGRDKLELKWLPKRGLYGWTTGRGDIWISAVYNTRILIHYCIINFNLSLFIFQLEIKHILNVNFVSIDERNWTKTILFWFLHFCILMVENFTTILCTPIAWEPSFSWIFFEKSKPIRVKLFKPSLDYSRGTPLHQNLSKISVGPTVV